MASNTTRRNRNNRNRKTRRSNELRGLREKLGLTKKCPPGKILRAPYKRYFSRSTKEQGYSVHKQNRSYRIYPKVTGVLVKAACVEDRGLPGKGPREGEGFAKLRKGELSKFGYNAHKSEEERYKALKKAIDQYGALEVYHKLDAIAKLTKRTAPEASRIFVHDREWVRKSYPLKSRNE